MGLNLLAPERNIQKGRGHSPGAKTNNKWDRMKLKFLCSKRHHVVNVFHDFVLGSRYVTFEMFLGVIIWSCPCWSRVPSLVGTAHSGSGPVVIPSRKCLWAGRCHKGIEMGFKEEPKGVIELRGA